MFQRFFSKDENQGPGEKKKKKLGYLIVLGFIGILVMAFPTFIEKKDHLNEGLQEFHTVEETKATSATGLEQTMKAYEEDYEKELSDILTKIVGVDDVSVVINLDSTDEEVYQIEVQESEQVTTETDKAGGNRQITQHTNDKKTAYYRSDDGEKPVVIKRLKPHVRGVLVVARGVENLQVKAAVIEAIQRTLEVPMHRIAVMPKG
ncbi:stage III sporulation protein AG [Hazenella sp. IB182357]|uniref:Stage III sporulation protein AG n=1 Tax=Polycladospora coralii TaxID=2771432 RepID=A0A926NGN2_9BACL|nr:stage III sporulation protein AG [Polycladospora coralii]MBD1373239.1 stage III sporulation protein AG [Polycladospora coralii]MBS7530897.1 stage III sporulation protein AG [Polycladospora coralii]